jgi:periplasmic protein TonB
MHVVAAILLFTITFPGAVPKLLPASATRIFLSPPPKVLQKTGGGGQRQPIPAKKGRAPEAVARKVWVPPMVTRNDTPKLVVIAALAETPEYNISAPQIGDPLGRLGLPSGGIGGPGGIGDGGRDGIGPGDGSRQGGVHPPPTAYTGKLTRDPLLLYKEEPEYSDEARKARHEGTVWIDMDIDASGRPINMRVVRGLGLGLDEKAIAAVAHWKFRPAMAGDRVVTVPARVQVSFHLL